MKEAQGNGEVQKEDSRQCRTGRSRAGGAMMQKKGCRGGCVRCNGCDVRGGGIRLGEEACGDVRYARGNRAGQGLEKDRTVGLGL